MSLSTVIGRAWHRSTNAMQYNTIQYNTIPNWFVLGLSLHPLPHNIEPFLLLLSLYFCLNVSLGPFNWLLPIPYSQRLTRQKHACAETRDRRPKSLAESATSSSADTEASSLTRQAQAMDITVPVRGTTWILTDTPFETAYQYADIFRRTAKFHLLSKPTIHIWWGSELVTLLVGDISSATRTTRSFWSLVAFAGLLNFTGVLQWNADVGMDISCSRSQSVTLFHTEYWSDYPRPPAASQWANNPRFYDTCHIL